MDFIADKSRYSGYIAVVRHSGNKALFDRVEMLAPCILYALKEKLAWKISRNMPCGQWGDWVSSSGAIEKEFGLVVGRLLDSELFWMLVLKCSLLTAYEKMQASRPGLPSLFDAAGSDGYIDDNKAIVLLNRLNEENKALLAEMACEVSCCEMDFLFFLGGEVRQIFQKIMSLI